MDEDAAWYGSRPRPRPHCRPTRRDPSSRERGTAAPLFSAHHVYCGHGRPSQLLLSSCLNFRSFTSQDQIWHKDGTRLPMVYSVVSNFPLIGIHYRSCGAKIRKFEQILTHLLTDQKNLTYQSRPNSWCSLPCQIALTLVYCVAIEERKPQI